MKTETGKKHKSVFVAGPISPEFIANSIAKHQVKTDIGAHNIFLGQVRADSIEGREVVAIEYSAYNEMADKVFHEIREEAFGKFELSCMHIYHSLGAVKAGEICLFVFVSSRHRDMAYQASRHIVEEIKARVPIFGKELFADDSYAWKENI
jgi:molybdopterin synthase catalytic subunit